jgi:hypothetical protein
MYTLVPREGSGLSTGLAVTGPIAMHVCPLGQSLLATVSVHGCEVVMLQRAWNSTIGTTPALAVRSTFARAVLAGSARNFGHVVGASVVAPLNPQVGELLPWQAARAPARRAMAMAVGRVIRSRIVQRRW